MHLFEKATMIENPVKRCVGEDQVEFFTEFELVDVHEEKAHVSFLLRFGRLDHPLGRIHSNHHAVRDELGQLYCQRSVTAT